MKKKKHLGNLYYSHWGTQSEQQSNAFMEKWHVFCIYTPRLNAQGIFL